MFTPEPEVRVAENKRELGGVGGEGRPLGPWERPPVTHARYSRPLHPAAAAKLSCSYSGFSSPRVEWKFAQGDTTSLVCYNNKITGDTLHPCPACPGCAGTDPPGFPLQRAVAPRVGGAADCSFSQRSSSLCPCFCLPAASYEDRVTFSHSGITFHSVTRKDTGTYTCMVSDEGGNTYGEASVQLLVLGTRPVSPWGRDELLPQTLSRLRLPVAQLIVVWVGLLSHSCQRGPEPS